MVARHRRADEPRQEARLRQRAATLAIPLVAAHEVLYHTRARRPLQDVLTALRHGVTLSDAGRLLKPNDEHALKSPHAFARLFADDPAAVARTLRDRRALHVLARPSCAIAIPSERLPDGTTSAAVPAHARLRGRARALRRRRSRPTSRAQLDTRARADRRARLRRLLPDDVRDRRVLPASATSCARAAAPPPTRAVCFCLGITAVDPVRMDLLFERFLSRERAEPPDIDLDIEHERREEVIQHVYAELRPRPRRDGRATSSATAPRSAVRDVGKVLGIPETALDRAVEAPARCYGDVEREALAQRRARSRARRRTRAPAAALPTRSSTSRATSRSTPAASCSATSRSTTLVPIENGAMPGRTVIQWDKDDARGARRCSRSTCSASARSPAPPRLRPAARSTAASTSSMATIPADDPATYDMICTRRHGRRRSRSRAARRCRCCRACKPAHVLRPRRSRSRIVRPGPITGGMVHPYLRRRAGDEPVEYPHPCLEPVLAKTLGVPLFQEQVMQLAVVAADYTPGEADQLRRDMAAWRTHRPHREAPRAPGRRAWSAKGIAREFAERVFEQIRGFGEYGFPESHAASFALIAYATCVAALPPPRRCSRARCSTRSRWASTRPRRSSRTPSATASSCCPIDVTRQRLGLHAGDGERRSAAPVAAHGPALRQRASREATAQRIARRARASGRSRRSTTSCGARSSTTARTRALAEAGAFARARPNRREALWQVRRGCELARSHATLDSDLGRTTPKRRVVRRPRRSSRSIGWDYRAAMHLSARAIRSRRCATRCARSACPTRATVRALPRRPAHALRRASSSAGSGRAPRRASCS